MAIDPINIGSVANDGTGDPIRQAFEKVNANEAELDSRLAQAEADIGNLDKSDVGLGNVDNTADADKPVSTATQAALDQKVNESLLGVADGVATLDSGGKVPSTQLPSYVDDVLEFTDFAAFPATGEGGKIYVALDTNKTYRWSGSEYIYITSGAVDSVAGKTGVVTLVKADVGLGNVNNTSDADKPVSTATQAALDTKVDKVTGKGLSTEDYTTTEKNKLAGVAEGATANSSDSYLLNSANHAYDNTVSGLTATDVQGAIDETHGLLFGVDQTWQNVTGSRALGVNYTNTTGKTIFLAFRGISAVDNSLGVQLNVDGVDIYSFAPGRSGNQVAPNLFIPIPVGATYSISVYTGTSSTYEWREYR